MGEVSSQGDRSKPANESAEERNERLHREVEAACRADPNCTYHAGDEHGDGDDAFVFFDNHLDHHSKGKVTRKRAVRR
jgi:hypothetical protein